MYKAIAEMGFEEATPIQAQSIPDILTGRDAQKVKPRQEPEKPVLLEFPPLR